MLQSQGESGGGGEALCYFASTGYAAEQGTGFQGHNAFVISVVTAVCVLFLLKLQEHLQLSLLRTGCLFYTGRVLK